MTSALEVECKFLCNDYLEQKISDKCVSQSAERQHSLSCDKSRLRITPGIRLGIRRVIVEHAYYAWNTLWNTLEGEELV